MNGIPTWAKLIGSTLIGGTILLGVFVTRYELDPLVSRLDRIENKLDTVLLGRQGTSSPLSRNPVVERAWQTALRLVKASAETRKKARRPDVIIEAEPRFVLPDADYRICGSSYALWTKEGDNFKADVRVFIYGPRDEAEAEKILIHEYLHYLLGHLWTPISSAEAEMQVLSLYPQGVCNTL